jgi:hypothetical protein
MKPGLSPLFALALMCVAVPQAEARTAALPPPQPGALGAVVTRDKASFSFPMDPTRTFEWDLDADPVGSVEYRWSVAVSDGGAKYVVGFFKLRRSAGDSAQSGRLEDLLKRGNLGLFRQDEQGRLLMVEGASVSAAATPTGLVLTITGADLVDRVLSARPSSVTFEVAAPGSAPDAEDVLVNYAQ